MHTSFIPGPFGPIRRAFEHLSEPEIEELEQALVEYLDLIARLSDASV